MARTINDKELRIKNHFVPKSYLKSWCDHNNKLWTYRTLVSNENVPLWKRNSPSAVAYYANLYTRLGDRGLDDEIERWFASDFESTAQGAIDRVLKDLKLSRKDWNNLVRFVALQDARTPVRLMDHMERAPKDFSEALNDIAEEIQRPEFINSKLSNREGIEDNNLLPVKLIPIIENNETC